MSQLKVNNCMQKYTYTKIKDYIWQIAEDDGVYCTLILGNELAVLIDTGYGKRNLREFIETNISTPYIVINTHGHPDHAGGNHWFETVYSFKKEWDVIEYFTEKTNKQYELKEIKCGQKISLGNINIEIVPLEGHTKGSLGVLLLEEKILISGDALNEGVWLFNYGSLAMDDLYKMAKRTMKLDFEYYICGHSDKLYQKNKIIAHIKNIEKLNINNTTKQNTIGFETYCSEYEDLNGKSHIIFTKDKI